MKSSKLSKIAILGLTAGLVMGSTLSSAAAVSAEPPEYLKGVTYVSDAWVINFWNTESDNMEAELKQIADDGFNMIVLAIPWREFQPTTNPISYNDYAFQKLDAIMRAAEAQGLWVELRVSYTWDFYADSEARLRFRELIGNDSQRKNWLDYVKKLYDTASAYPNFHGGFITWEDFWNYMEDATKFGTGSESIAEAKRCGFQDYLMEHHTLDELNEYYAPVKTFHSHADIYLPDKNSPAYLLLFQFYDEFLMDLLTDAQQVFPNLSMEVRLDVDPVQGLDGEMVGAHHFSTFGCGDSDYTSLMYSVAMGQENKGERISAEQALAAADAQLNVVKLYNGGKPIFIDQLLYVDGTEAFAHNAQIVEEERNDFITGLTDILNKYTNGYAVWSYWNYTNNAVYNSQFALGTRGWDTSRATVESRGNSNQIKLDGSGRIQQKIGHRINNKQTHNNHVRFTADSDSPVTLYIELGNVTKEVTVNGKKQYDLNFGNLSYDSVTFRAGKGTVYVDNIDVYNFIQDGQLHDIDGNELSSMQAIRTLNQSLDR
ncbi:MAG: cellulase family glycosylhydrolase [Lachnospiraceae bacterium]